MPRLTVDIVSEDPTADEFVLHLIEEGPWEIDALKGRLQTIQNRLYDAVDLIIDGNLVKRYPESKGKSIRIQLDCFDEPNEVHELTERFQKHMLADPECLASIRACAFASNIRIISRRIDKKAP